MMPKMMNANLLVLGGWRGKGSSIFIILAPCCFYIFLFLKSQQWKEFFSLAGCG
jgi:hypothetical protein